MESIYYSTAAPFQSLFEKASLPLSLNMPSKPRESVSLSQVVLLHIQRSTTTTTVETCVWKHNGVFARNRIIASQSNLFALCHTGLFTREMKC